MKPDMTNVRTLLHSTRFEIPPYQREYQWGPEQWQSIWRDLGILYESGDDVPKHFTGILLLEPLETPIGGVQAYSVIDGQQRLITLFTLSMAIRDAGREELRAVQDDDLFWVRRADGDGEDHRIRAQKNDADQLMRIADGEWRDWYHGARSAQAFSESRILWAYAYFRYCIWFGTDSFKADEIALPRYKKSQLALAVEDLWRANGAAPSAREDQVQLPKLKSQLARLAVLALKLQPEDEDAPTVFESINAKRTELQQWDFIRNLIFTRFEAERAAQIFHDHWEEVQAHLGTIKWENKRTSGRDGFIYDYLIARGEQGRQGTIGRNRGFQHLRKRLAHELGAVNASDHDDRLEEFVVDDLLSAARVWPIAVGAQLNPIGSKKSLPPTCAVLVESITRISSGPPFPILLHYIELWNRGALDATELRECLAMVENFLARMVICKRPLSPLRALFMQGMASIAPTAGSEALRSWLVGTLEAPGAFPLDLEVEEAVRTGDYYGPGGVAGTQLGAVFRGLERRLAGNSSHPLPYGSGSDDFTVEHVLPQSCVAPPHKAWGEDLAKWKADPVKLAQRVNRLGNLTLLTFKANSYVKARRFEVKCAVFENRDAKCPHPILAVNQSIYGNKRWTHKEIDDRTELLLGAFLKRWPTL